MTAPMPAGQDAQTAEGLFAESVRRFGIEHTHDATCRTWHGWNWEGACDCTLDERTGTFTGVGARQAGGAR